ncbi:MAG: histidine kinase N-terminal 7TM domain-containing protein [Chloroflexota bacterium]
MTGNPLIIFSLLLAATGISIIAAFFAWTRRGMPGASAFLLLNLAIIVWTLTSALEKIPADISTRIMISKFQYLGITSVGPLWLLFCLSYTQQEHRLGRTAKLALWAIPIITCVLVAINEHHGLIWPQVLAVSNVPGSPLVYEHGAWFWVSTAYLYILLLAGSILLVRAFVRYPQIYKRQSAIILVGAAIPWIGNVIYLLGLSPVHGLDLTPIGFTLSGMIIAWGIFRLKLFDLGPIARTAIVEMMIDGIIVFDAGGQIIDINPKAKEMLDLPQGLPLEHSEQALVQRWPDLVEHYRDVPQIQTEIHLNSSIQRDLEMRITSLQDQRGGFLGRLVMLRDITDQKQLEKLRDILTQTIVHDLRNPLTVISTSLEILRTPSLDGDSLSEEQDQVLEIASVNVQRMSDLISSILDISRMEQGSMPVRRAPFALAILATNAIDLQSLLADSKNLRLENNVSRDLPQALGDAALIQRVLQNLLDNAVKFTPDGGTVQVNASYQPEEHQIVVEICDTGLGIPTELQPRLFQKFVAGTHSRSGSGLGLAFCRLAVEAHGGSIWIESENNSGTKFVFTLPAVVLEPA